MPETRFGGWQRRLAAACLFAVPIGLWLVPAPAAEKAPPVVRQTAEQDHQHLMDLLGIKELRRGRNGTNKSDSNFANYDESKANPFPDLPDALTLKNGKKVTKASDWWSKRRPEIVEDFDREVYGRVPKGTPKVKWEAGAAAPGKNGDVDILTRQITGLVDNSSYPDIEVKIALTLVTPANVKSAMPVVMQLGGFGGGGRAETPAGPPYPPNAFAPAPPAGRGAGVPLTARAAPPTAPVPTWQQQVLARGWGYAILNPGSIQADNGAGLTLGIIGLVNKGQPRRPEDWGTLRAWAWGVSRAIDYLETEKSVDARHIALQGHSRYGKATMVAMAYEPRLWTAFVSSAGEGGPKLHRRNWGQIIENIAGVSEYHWMGGNLLKYAGPLNWNDLPVDAHELIAMCAPRPVFLSMGKGGYDAEPGGDSWVDAKGTFLAAAAAGPVYRLLGKRPMDRTDYPPSETMVGADADIAFRQHAAGHTDVPNWPYFLDFAAKHLK